MAITKGPQVFPRSEYLRRIASVKSEMAERELHTLVVSFDRSMNYLTGYSAPTVDVPQALVIAADKEEPTLILRLMDAPGAHYLSFLERENVLGYPESLINNPDEDGYDFIIDFIQQSGAAKRGLGLEIGNLPPISAGKFRARLPDATIADFTGAITRIRMVKSDLEIALMKEAAAITDAAMLRASEVIRPGVREADAVAEIVATLVRGADGKPGTKIANYHMTTSPRTGVVHFEWWTEDSFRYGSQVNLEIAGVRHSYTAPMSRTFSIGNPSERLRRLHEAQLAGHEAALKMIRPGRTCSEVAQAARRAIEKHGVQSKGRLGSPVGIDWAEAGAKFVEGDTMVLKPNMTWYLNLANCPDEDFGMKVGQCVRVTETGVEVLTKAPLKLFEI